MLNYLFRERNRIFEIDSGTITQLGYIVHDVVEGNFSPMNNKPLAWYRGTAWSVGAKTQDTKGSASLEITDNSLLNQFTKITIDGYAVEEGVDWVIEDTAEETALSIKNAINIHPILQTKITVIVDENIIYFKSILAGAATNFSFIIDDLSGFKINNQNTTGDVSFSGGANSSKNFAIFRYNLQTTAFNKVFDEEANQTKPTVANLPKSNGLLTLGENLYYIYFKANWDESKLVLGYRTFSLATAAASLIVTDKIEKEFSINPNDYFTISDIIDFNGDIFVSITSDLDQIARIFRIDVANELLTEITNLSSHIGRSEIFLIHNNNLYSFNSAVSRFGKYNSSLLTMENTGNPNTITFSDPKFKIGVSEFNSEFYVAYTDTFWQGRLVKTASLETNSPWTSVTTIGTPLTYHFFTTLVNPDPVVSDRLLIFDQTSSGAGYFSHLTLSGSLILDASTFPVIESAGLLPFNQSHPDVLIEGIQTKYTGNVTVTYRVYDLEEDLVNIKFEFSNDGGNTWNLGTIVSGTQDMGTLTGSGVLLSLDSLESRLSFSNNGGLPHYFDWNSLTDLGFGAFDNVRLRLTAFSGSP